MTIFARLTSTLGRPSTHLRPLALTLIAACSVALLCAASAGAVVTTVGSQTFGYEPEAEGFEAAAAATPLIYEGGPVVHENAPYAIYWDPVSGAYSGEWEQLISGFFEGAGAESGSLANVFAVSEQYSDASGKVAYNSSFRGAYTDVDPYPKTENCAETAAVCLTDAQIRTELSKYIAANSLPTGLNPSSGTTPIYFVFTPPGVAVCLQGSGAKGNCSTPSSADPLCSYHSFINANGTTVLYAVQPWTAGNYGTVGVTHVSGTHCQDGTAITQEPNQIGLGRNGEYNAGLADLIINEVADEQTAILTDPLLTAWHDPGTDKDEVPDKCRDDFLGGLLLELSKTIEEKTEAADSFNQAIAGRKYLLNDEFDQAALYNPYPGVPCINEVNLEPSFTSPNPVGAGTPVTFNATESTVDLGISKYSWNFGDGSSAEVNCGSQTPTDGYFPAECDNSSGTGNPNSVASVVHQYTYGGTYEVTLTITDDGNNVASVTHEITVSGPARPTQTSSEGSSQTSAGSTSTAATSSSSSAPATSPGPTAAPVIPAPVAATAIASRSLKTAISKGLVVNYSVNEQVAGHFEVLLNRTIARKLGITGTPAAALPAGSPAELVIAKAILVTTKGGRSAVDIKFSKRTAARLARSRKVALMLRLVVRNAATSNPATTTVVSSVTLNG